ncbi:DgyrCDS3849 [Dimorphilus gyrociliatus]|uniref:DgyrCDS3849 n=1 Tax=Dimorphilus gyrociliatus TaxID=2664684 RepID=A0A7I8VF42_9ANNE|nr:DgyrCDS3849 [Dimorphilus gyrociliatus]
MSDAQKSSDSSTENSNTEKNMEENDKCSSEGNQQSSINNEDNQDNILKDERTFTSQVSLEVNCKNEHDKETPIIDNSMKNDINIREEASVTEAVCLDQQSEDENIPAKTTHKRGYEETACTENEIPRVAVLNAQKIELDELKELFSSEETNGEDFDEIVRKSEVVYIRYKSFDVTRKVLKACSKGILFKKRMLYVLEEGNHYVYVEKKNKESDLDDFDLRIKFEIARNELDETLKQAIENIYCKKYSALINYYRDKYATHIICRNKETALKDYNIYSPASINVTGGFLKRTIKIIAADKVINRLHDVMDILRSQAKVIDTIILPKMSFVTFEKIEDAKYFIETKDDIVCYMKIEFFPLDLKEYALYQIDKAEKNDITVAPIKVPPSVTNCCGYSSCSFMIKQEKDCFYDEFEGVKRKIAEYSSTFEIDFETDSEVYYNFKNYSNLEEFLRKEKQFLGSKKVDYHIQKQLTNPSKPLSFSDSFIILCNLPKLETIDELKNKLREYTNSDCKAFFSPKESNKYKALIYFYEPIDVENLELRFGIHSFKSKMLVVDRVDDGKIKFCLHNSNITLKDLKVTLEKNNICKCDSRLIEDEIEILLKEERVRDLKLFINNEMKYKSKVLEFLPYIETFGKIPHNFPFHQPRSGIVDCFLYETEFTSFIIFSVEYRRKLFDCLRKFKAKFSINRVDDSIEIRYNYNEKVCDLQYSWKEDVETELNKFFKKLDKYLFKFSTSDYKIITKYGFELDGILIQHDSNCCVVFKGPVTDIRTIKEVLKNKLQEHDILKEMDFDVESPSNKEFLLNKKDILKILRKDHIIVFDSKPKCTTELGIIIVQENRKGIVKSLTYFLRDCTTRKKSISSFPRSSFEQQLKEKIDNKNSYSLSFDKKNLFITAESKEIATEIETIFDNITKSFKYESFDLEIKFFDKNKENISKLEKKYHIEFTKTKQKNFYKLEIEGPIKDVDDFICQLKLLREKKDITISKIISESHAKYLKKLLKSSFTPYNRQLFELKDGVNIGIGELHNRQIIKNNKDTLTIQISHKFSQDALKDVIIFPDICIKRCFEGEDREIRNIITETCEKITLKSGATAYYIDKWDSEKISQMTKILKKIDKDGQQIIQIPLISKEISNKQQHIQDLVSLIFKVLFIDKLALDFEDLQTIQIITHSQKSTENFKPILHKRVNDLLQNSESYDTFEYIDFPPSILKVKYGDLTSEKADVIAYSNSRSLNFNKGIAKALSDAAGEDLEKECKIRNFRENITVTKGFKLHCRYVFHLYLEKSSSDRNYTKLDEILKICFTEAKSLKVKSLSLPLLGAGYLNYPDEYVIDTIKHISDKYGRENGLEKVTIVIQSEHILNKVEKQLSILPWVEKTDHFLLYNKVQIFVEQLKLTSFTTDALICPIPESNSPKLPITEYICNHFRILLNHNELKKKEVICTKIDKRTIIFSKPASGIKEQLFRALSTAEENNLRSITFPSFADNIWNDQPNHTDLFNIIEMYFKNKLSCIKRIELFTRKQCDRDAFRDTALHKCYNYYEAKFIGKDLETLNKECTKLCKKVQTTVITLNTTCIQNKKQQYKDVLNKSDTVDKMCLGNEIFLTGLEKDVNEVKKELNNGKQSLIKILISY